MYSVNDTGVVEGKTLNVIFISLSIAAIALQ